MTREYVEFCRVGLRNSVRFSNDELLKVDVSRGIIQIRGANRKVELAYSGVSNALTLYNLLRERAMYSRRGVV